MTAVLSSQQLDRLKAAIESDIAKGQYYGAVVAVSRHGEPAWLEAIGHADATGKTALAKNSVFSIFSITKAFTNLLIFQAVDRGLLALTERVSAVIPEFGGGLRSTVTFYHLLTQSSGLPSIFTLGAGRYIDRFDEVFAAIVQLAHCESPPGERVTYSPMVAHVLMAEAARRVDPKKRTVRQLMTEEVFVPLGMKDSALGVRADLKSRHVIPDLRGNVPAQHLGHSDYGPDGAFQEEHAEMPWVGAVSTVPICCDTQRCCDEVAPWWVRGLFQRRFSIRRPSIVPETNRTSSFDSSVFPVVGRRVQPTSGGVSSCGVKPYADINLERLPAPALTAIRAPVVALCG